jgi:ubiquinone/menaquinone biosynthesis C-methylase UbiE
MRIISDRSSLIPAIHWPLLDDPKPMMRFASQTARKLLTAMDGKINERSLSALAYPREEMESHLACYVSRRMPLTSPEWHSLVTREVSARMITARYWRNRILGWTSSRQFHQQAVEDTYDNIWADIDFANFVDPNKQLMLHEWDREGLVMNSAATHKLHQILMTKVLRALATKSVLEVGSGTGINLVVLASQCPGTRFQGIELTKKGVELSRSLIAAPKLPAPLRSFMAEPPTAPGGFHDVIVTRGSAEKLPYADASFDLVMTRLALEQMESIREDALSEIARVARSYVLMIESFREMNDKGIRRKYAIANNYFRGRLSDLPRHGLEPVFVYSDWPHKITLKPVFVLAKKASVGT